MTGLLISLTEIETCAWCGGRVTPAKRVAGKQHVFCTPLCRAAFNDETKGQA